MQVLVGINKRQAAYTLLSPIPLFQLSYQINFGLLSSFPPHDQHSVGLAHHLRKNPNFLPVLRPDHRPDRPRVCDHQARRHGGLRNDAPCGGIHAWRHFGLLLLQTPPEKQCPSKGHNKKHPRIPRETFFQKAAARCEPSLRRDSILSVLVPFTGSADRGVSSPSDSCYSRQRSEPRQGSVCGGSPMEAVREEVHAAWLTKKKRGTPALGEISVKSGIHRNRNFYVILFERPQYPKKGRVRDRGEERPKIEHLIKRALLLLLSSHYLIIYTRYHIYRLTD